MDSTLRILLFTEDATETGLISEKLEEFGISHDIAYSGTRTSYEEELKRGKFDLIISEYSHPDDTGYNPLALAHSLSPDTPFIYLSGTVGDDRAVDSLLSGATDFVLRNNLQRLPIAVERAVNERTETYQRRVAETQLHTMTSRLYTVLENIHDGILFEDADRNVLYINNMFRSIFKPVPAIDFDANGSATDIFDEIGSRFIDEERFFSNIGRFLREKQPAYGEEYELEDRRFVECDAIPVYIEGRFNGMLWQFREITTKKHALRALHESEHRYRLFFEEDLTGDFISDASGIIRACNSRFVSMFGFSSTEEALGSDFFSLFHGRSSKRIILHKLNQQERLEYVEKTMCRLDGKPIFVVTNLIGSYDASNKLEQIKGYLFDDTRRKLLEQQLLQAQKMESIGTLAGGIAHDFNNILGIILGHSSILERRLSNPEKLKKSAEAIAGAVRRGSGVVQQLLTFARRSRMEMDLVKVNDVVTDVTELLKEILPKTIHISVRLHPDLPAIIMDHNQLHQALLNLCINARDAMNMGGDLTITTALLKSGEISHRFPDLQEERYIRISVSDAGIGMDPDIADRIFEPFFTTKEPGKGTGLGLSVVYGVVSGHNGYIDLESKPGDGTTFHLYFPAPHVDDVPQPVSIAPIPSEHRGDGTILIAEDEEALLEILIESLNEKGYEVLIARDGLEAVDIYRKNKENIGLVISDIGLPKISGWETVEHMRRINPDVKIILITGYLGREERGKIESIGADKVIMKPFEQNELLAKIKELYSGS